MNINAISLNRFNSAKFQTNATKSISFKGMKDKGISIDEAIKKFESIHIKAEKLENGTLKISHYEPSKYDILDLDNKEAELFEHVSEIEGYADFGNSKLKSTGALEKVGKTVRFCFSEIETTPNLKYVGKDVYYTLSQIKKCNGIVVGRDMHIENSKIKDANSATVGRCVHLRK